MQQSLAIAIALFRTQLRTVSTAMLFEIHLTDPCLSLVAVFAFGIRKKLTNRSK